VPPVPVPPPVAGKHVDGDACTWDVVNADPGGKDLRLDGLEDPAVCEAEAPMRTARRVLAFKTDDQTACDPGDRVAVFYSVTKDDNAVADPATVRVLAGYCLAPEGTEKFNLRFE
jgi:hypothetical protein